MKLSPIVITLALSALVGSNASPSSSLSGEGKFAIARAFSPNDAENLVPSFDAWRYHPPCDGAPSYAADLVLVFSGNLQNSTLAKDALHRVTSIFKATNGFGNCFDKLLRFESDIEASEDFYEPTAASSNPLWVNGPNRLFERTFRAMQARNYTSFFLMEMDSVPVRPLWLDTLVEEIDVQPSDFAILGSTYRGYKWDNFYSELPASLRMHINGNAVYNPHHPVLERLVTALEGEARTAGNTVAFDYRLGQIIYESKTGEQAAFPHGDTLPLPPTYGDLFAGMNVDWDQVVRETPLIANFAGTNIVPQYLGDDIVIAHGARMFDKWNSNVMGNLSLIVSDWEPSNVHILLQSLETSSHPFAEIVVMVPESTIASSRIIGDTLVRMVPRSSHIDAMDLCTAPVSTRWTMKTNSYFRIRQAVPILVHDKKPAITFSTPTKETCFDFSSCVKDLKHATAISFTANRVFDDNDMVYDVEMRDKYCSHVVAAIHESPSATEYVAYLEVMQPENSMYSFSERAIGGLLSPFLRLSDFQVPEQLKREYHRRLEDSTNFTGSSAGSPDRTCTGSGTEEECRLLGCTWNDDLKTCRSEPSFVIEQQPSAKGAGRPPVFTAIIAIAIAVGSIALIGLVYLGYTRISQEAVADSVQPFDGSMEPVAAYHEDDEADSSLRFGSEFEYSKISGASFVDIGLDDGHFEERSGGVEYVH